MDHRLDCDFHLPGTVPGAVAELSVRPAIARIESRVPDVFARHHLDVRGVWVDAAGDVPGHALFSGAPDFHGDRVVHCGHGGVHVDHPGAGPVRSRQGGLGHGAGFLQGFVLAAGGRERGPLLARGLEGRQGAVLRCADIFRGAFHHPDHHGAHKPREPVESQRHSRNLGRNPGCLPAGALWVAGAGGVAVAGAGIDFFGGALALSEPGSVDYHAGRVCHHAELFDFQPLVR